MNAPANFNHVYGVVIAQNGYVQNLCLEQLPSVPPFSSGVIRMWYNVEMAKVQYSFPAEGGTIGQTPDTIVSLATTTDVVNLQTTVGQEIDNEATVRQQADDALQVAINNEAQLRANGDQEVISSTAGAAALAATNAVQAETTRAEGIEGSLQSQITAITQQLQASGAQVNPPVVHTSQQIVLSSNNVGQALDNFPTATYRLGKYQVTASYQAALHFIELTVYHDGQGNAHIGAFGSYNNTGPLATYSASVVNGQLIIAVTPTNPNTKFTFDRALFLL